MKRVLILCEGQSEEYFVNQVLRPHLSQLQIFVSCTRICTSREEGRRAHRGGHFHRFEFIRRDIGLLLKSNPDIVTTLIDLYAFPRDMPGFPSPIPSQTADKVAAIEIAFAKEINNTKFLPGIIVHEFEGLLFSAPSEIAAKVCTDTSEEKNITSKLMRIAELYSSPEDINDSPETAPSKRLVCLLPSYSKTRHGPEIARAIGLDTIRRCCQHFSRWLSRLEQL